MKLSRLARAIQEQLSVSYTKAKREVEIGHVLVNDEVITDPGFVIEPGHSLTHNPNLPSRRRLPATHPIEILYLDGDLVVVNKPTGLLVHPTFAGEQDTVVSRVGAEVERRTGRHRRVLVVHRLDQDTSGVLVLALTHDTVEHLQRQFRIHSVERRYLALTAGDLQHDREVANAIGRPRPGARLAALGPGHGGRPALTVIRPLERFGRATLVEAELGTGRTHQVRVHLSFLGHPVLGDHVYGDAGLDPVRVPRLALHAAHLAFVHPRTGERLAFHQALPDDLARVVSALRRHHQLPEPRVAPPETLRPPRRSATATSPPHPRKPRQLAASPTARRTGSAPHLRPAKARRRS